jgi:hypothetical protein
MHACALALYMYLLCVVRCGRRVCASFARMEICSFDLRERGARLLKD